MDMKKITWPCFAIALAVMSGCESLPSIGNNMLSYDNEIQIGMVTGKSVVMDASNVQISTSPSFVPLFKEIGGTDENEMIVSGFTPNTTYYYRHFVKDTMGGVKYGSTHTFATNNLSMEVLEPEVLPNSGVPDRNVVIKVKVSDDSHLSDKASVYVRMSYASYNDGISSCSNLGGGIWEMSFYMGSSEMPYQLTVTPELHYWRTSDGDNVVEQGTTKTFTLNP